MKNGLIDLPRSVSVRKFQLAAMYTTIAVILAVIGIGGNDATIEPTKRRITSLRPEQPKVADTVASQAASSGAAVKQRPERSSVRPQHLRDIDARRQVRGAINNVSHVDSQGVDESTFQASLFV